MGVQILNFKRGVKFLSLILVFFIFKITDIMSQDTIKITDATNYRFLLSSPPKKVISLNPSTTETLYAIGAGDAVLGVTVYCRYPEDVRDKERIGTVLEPDVEKIIALRPDLVFATLEGNPLSCIKSLRNSGLKVFVLGEVHSFSDLFNRMELLGRLMGREEDSKRLIGSLKKEIEYLRSKVLDSPKPKVFLQLGDNPIVTASKNTLLGEILEIAGTTNIAEEAPVRYPIYSMEQIALYNPEVIIIVTMSAQEENIYKRWKLFPELKAVKNNKIYIVDADLLCNLGPRIIKGLKLLMGLIHPEVSIDSGEDLRK